MKFEISVYVLGVSIGGNHNKVMF